MIYFDNAATSFPKPPSVIKEVEFCLKKYCGNPGRSSHRLSLKASEEIYSVRERVADLISVDHPEQVVFTYNATHALNLAIKSFITHKCHILTSDFEHNSVIRPLERLKKDIGIEYSSFNSDGDIEANILNAIREDTEGIVCSIASNVCGDHIPLPILSKVAQNKKLFLIIDASAAIGHYEINLENTPCDVLCAPGHKALFGIQGSGFAYFKDNLRKEGLIEGGSGSDSRNLYMPYLLPEGYEAGTLSTPAIVSLGEGIRVIEHIGLNEINEKLLSLTRAMEDRLSSINEIKLYKSGCGLISFNIRNLSSSYVSKLLDDYGICVRGGLHCAPTIHRKMGTLETGAVRISFSYFNNLRQIDRVYRVISDISKTI